MSLSTEKIYDIFVAEDIPPKKIERFIDEFLLKFLKIDISNVLCGWNGVDNRFPILMIRLAECHRRKIKKFFDISIYPDFIEEKKIHNIYTTIYDKFVGLFQTEGFKIESPSYMYLQAVMAKRYQKV